MVHEKNRYINLYELTEFSQKSHVKKDLIKTGGFNTVLICLDDGQEIPPHPEPYYVVFLVLKGEGVITRLEILGMTWRPGILFRSKATRTAGSGASNV